MRSKKRILVIAVLLFSPQFFAGLIVWFLFFSANTVTRENFLRLEFGMKQQQVEEIFGRNSEPWYVKSSPANQTRLLWRGDGIAFLRFSEEGRLVTKFWKEEGFSSFTKERFFLINPDMALAEATAIIGRPPDQFSKYADNQASARWIDIDGIAAVHFTNAKVDSCHWISGGGIMIKGGRSLFQQNMRDLFGIK